MRTIKVLKAILSFTALCVLSTKASAQITIDSIADGSAYSYIACPSGAGPFAAVLYNHGGSGTSVGGDLRATAIALAQAGYLARAEKRTETTSLVSEHIMEVEAALAALRSDTRADTNCVSIIGFSRGGYFTLEVAKQHPALLSCIISMAPANPAGSTDSLVKDVSPFDDPLLILVASNDTLIDENVARSQMLYDSLISAGKMANLIIYPGYDSNGDLVVDGTDDGHELFKKVQDPYWTDVINFLNTHSCPSSGLHQLAQKSSFTLYPHPMRYHTSLEFENPQHENYSLVLLNSQGQVVKTINSITSNKVEIERQGLTAGLYFFQLWGLNQQRILSGKLCIE